MTFFNKILRSKKLFIINLSLVSLLLGSFLTTVIYTGCSEELGQVFAKTGNDLVRKDKDALSSALLIQRAFRNVAKSIRTAVVSVNIIVKNVQHRDPFRGFFRDFFGPRYRRRQRKKSKKFRPVGSGFVVNKKGYLVTNYHVVKRAKKIKVVFPDKREFMAKVVGTDRETDLAVLKIKPSGKIPVISLGDSDKIEVGDWAIAIGNPFNLPGTFTVGVVSAKSRAGYQSAFQRFIQVDTAINPGNSGGPLVNIEGEVIGINTMIYTKSGGSLGIGFAVPINLAKNVVQQLISKGHFDRGYLGIFLGKIDKNLRKALKLSDGEGALVNSVIECSPAEKAGLKEGDVILKINGKKIKSFTHLMQIVAGFPVNKVVRILVLRNGTKKVNIKLKIGKRPGEEKLSKKKKTTETWLGLKIVSVSDLSERERRRYRIRRNEKGVVVHKLTSDEYEGGLQAGDLIKAINYIPIYGIKSYRKFIKRYRDRKSFIFKIKRGGRTMFIAINS